MALHHWTVSVARYSPDRTIMLELFRELDRNRILRERAVGLMTVWVKFAPQTKCKFSQFVLTCFFDFFPLSWVSGVDNNNSSDLIFDHRPEGSPCMGQNKVQ